MMRKTIRAAEFPSRGEQDGPCSRLPPWEKELEQDIGEGMRGEQRAGGAQGVPHFLAGGRWCLLGVPDTPHCSHLSSPGPGSFQAETVLPISEPWYPVMAR